MTPVLAALACIGAFGVTCWALIFMFGIFMLWREGRRETAEAERSMERHPAGGCEGFRMSTPDPLRAPCGAWIGDGVCDYWEREFAALSHALECKTCQSESQLPNWKGEAA